MRPARLNAGVSQTAFIHDAGNTMSFRLEYEVAEAGWATCRVAFGEESVVMTASYLHDSLHQLCDIVASIANGASAGIVVFMGEPGEHHLFIERSGGTEVVVRVLWHDGWESWGLASQSDERLVLQGQTTVAHLRGQVYSAARRILDSLGPGEYRRLWVAHDFPQAAYDRLRNAG